MALPPLFHLEGTAVLSAYICVNCRVLLTDSIALIQAISIFEDFCELRRGQQQRNSYANFIMLNMSFIIGPRASHHR